MICYDCKREITDRVVWLAEDYRDEGGEIAGPYAFHEKCADQPWPLYELTDDEAALWADRGKDAWAIVWAARA